MLVSIQKLWSKGGQGHISYQQLKLVMFKSHSGGAGFKGMKELWRAAEVWHHEKPSKTKGKTTSLAVTEAPGLKGS